MLFGRGGRCKLQQLHRFPGRAHACAPSIAISMWHETGSLVPLCRRGRRRIGVGGAAAIGREQACIFHLHRTTLSRPQASGCTERHAPRIVSAGSDIIFMCTFLFFCLPCIRLGNGGAMSTSGRSPPNADGCTSSAPAACHMKHKYRNMYSNAVLSTS